jgi:CubicO group peptidase (beta-lactamase class C family)
MTNAQLEALIARHAVTGASLAIVQHNTLTLASAGLRDAASAAPVTSRTVFDAASLTKPLVAYAALQLADRGAIDLDAPLGRSVAPIVADDAAALRITARHLLSHTAGLQNLRGKEPLRIFFEPGAWYSYASVGFTYLQAALEAITGEPLEATLQRLVFEPLGMRSSSLVWQDRFSADMAYPHEAGERQDKHRPAQAYASYSLQTTASDYAAFVSAVLRGDRLAEATAHAWCTPVVMVPQGEIVRLDSPPVHLESDIGWGLGWGLEPSLGTFFQWGKMTGLRAFVMGCPRLGSAVVLLTNSNTGLRLMRDVTREVLPGEHSALRWLAEGVSE